MNKFKRKITEEEAKNLPVLKTDSKYIGKTLGRLTILSLTERRRRINRFTKKDNYYLCKCSCGNFVIVRDGHLTDSSYKSCGCYIREITGNRSRGKLVLNRLAEGEASFHMLVGAYKKSAREANRTFLLTNEECRALFKGDCSYCGDAPYRETKKKDSYGNFIYNGIDRLDNDKGYEPDNVVSCCWPCNDLKGSYSVGEFIRLILKISLHQLSKILNWRSN